MRILHILTSINTGGAEKFCVDICNTQAAISDNKIYLCVLDKIRNQPLVNFISSNVTVVSLNKERRYSLKIPYKIYQLISDINPDIIHLNGRALVYASIPVMVKNIPSVYTVHTMVDRLNKYINLYFKFLFTRFSSLFTPVSISQSVLKTVQDIYGNQFDKIIYNGSSKLTVSSNVDLVHAFIDSMKENKNTLVFMYVGRIAKVKNTLLLIKVFNKLLDDGQNICLCIVGYDSSSNQNYLHECKKENKYPKRVQFVGRQENIADYLLYTDALCMTSNREGLGISALEAFSMGAPLLTTPAGGPQEIIISGVNGYVSKEITVDSYVEILEKFIEKPLRYKEKIINIYKNKYTMNICAKQYLNLYRQKAHIEIEDTIQ